MKDNADTRSLSLEFDLPHPPAKVWRALTEPELVSRWLMKTDMAPAVGKAFTFKNEPSPGWDGIVNCEMKEVERHRRLRYSWRSGGIDTQVTWTLAPTASGGTLLKLEQSGFRANEQNARFFEGAQKGWQWMAGQRLPQVLGELP
jgi:uncharacterized protein YndB with AHSA1/START domain